MINLLEKHLPEVLSMFQKVGLGSLQTPKSEKPDCLGISSLKGTFLPKVVEGILLLSVECLNSTKLAGFQHNLGSSNLNWWKPGYKLSPV